MSDKTRPRPPDDAAIVAACRRHGAATVHAAAIAALEGRPAALAALGLPARGIGDANDALRVAYRLLTDEEQAGDLAAVTIALAKLPPSARSAAPADDEGE